MVASHRARSIGLLFAAIALILGSTHFAPASATPALAANLGEVIPNQFVVLLKDGVDAHGEARAAVAAHGVQNTHVYEHALHGFAFKGSDQAAEALRHNPNVLLVSPDYLVQATAQTIPTGIRRISADTNPTSGIDGVDQRVNVNVAIIDTGIDPTHPDLNVVAGLNCADTTGRTPPYSDGHGHGTHTAGTVGALDNNLGVVGVAPGVNLYAIRVLDDTGSGSWSSVICGIDWATGTRTDADPTNDIAVANMSLGGGGSDDGNCGNTNGDLMHQAICRSVAAGVVYSVAAGNSSRDASTFTPAAYDEVITVAALGDSDGAPGGLGPATGYGPDETLASFSNFGADVDIAAPGVNILSTYNGGAYAYMSGTSMAAPHVTGAVALYVAQNGKATNAAGVAAIRQALINPTGGYSVAYTDPRGYTGGPEPLLFVGGGATPTPTASTSATATAQTATAVPPTVTTAPPTATSSPTARPTSSPTPTATTVPATHDVAVTGMTAPSSVVQTASATIVVTVANQGSVEEQFTVTLTDTTSGLVLGTQSVDLLAHVSTSLSFVWTPDAAVAATTHVLRADAGARPGEVNLTNNSKTKNVAVKAAIHDVATTGLKAPGSVTRGTAASVNATVSNKGNLTETFSVTLVDTTTGVTIGTQQASLDPGKNATLVFIWATSATTPTGAHVLQAMAGPVSGETSLSDNAHSATVTIK